LISGERAHLRIHASVDQLLAAGERAYGEGQRRLAHEVWREAAVVDPYNEQVWIALLKVLDTDEDRRVCLQNILVINPLNVEARHRLRVLRRTMVVRPDSQPILVPLTPSAPSLELILRVVLIALTITALGASLGILASVVVYGL
jgi:hypothetical protein